jgi:amidase
MSTFPTRDTIASFADQLGLDCSSSEIEELYECLPVYLSHLETSRTYWEQAVAAQAHSVDRSFRIPDSTENPLNAWTVVTSIQTTMSGPLAGRTIAIKDNINVAGLPLNNGSSLLDGYIGERDAEVVTRVLQSAGTITGKARCENFCLSGGSHTGWGGPVRNPHDGSLTSGGSSSGCAALVASGSVDMAIGGDQGGSIRIPSAFCGIVGLKPTWGKIPYDGAMPMEPSIDHLGPMTRTVADNVLLFDTLSGQRRSRSNSEALLARGASGLRIGRLVEGFAQENADPLVDELVTQAIGRLADGGAEVTDISVPAHRWAPVLWTAIGLAGIRRVIVEGDGFGTSAPSTFPLALIRHLRKARREGFTASLRTKQFIIASAIVHESHGIEPYAFSRNAVAALRDEYDIALKSSDILAMPTTPHAASRLPDDFSLKTSNFAAESMASNTVPFNMTHHPALTVPCGRVNGLPVGLMLVGRHGEEDLLFRAAASVEQQAQEYIG